MANTLAQFHHIMYTTQNALFEERDMYLGAMLGLTVELDISPLACMDLRL